MKIAMLIPSLGGGGAERVVLDLALGLARAGHSVDVFVLEDSDTFTIPEGVNIRYLQRWKTRIPPLLKGLSLFLAFRRLWGILKQERHDCAIGHMERCNSLVLFTPAGTRGILVVHNYLAHSLVSKSFFKKIFAKIVYSMAAKLRRPVFFVSETARNNGLQAFGFKAANTIAIPNFIHIEDIRQKSLREESASCNDTVRGLSVVTAGRLIEQKGHWHLIRAFSKVVEIVPEAKLVIFGEGPLRQKLQDLIKAYGLEAHIALPGFTGDIFHFLRNGRVFVLPSLYEGMPIVLLEALACEAAIIATDCHSGPREVLAPDTSLDNVAKDPEIYPAGILVPPLDGVWRDTTIPLTVSEEHLAHAIIRLLEDAPLNMVLRQGAAQRAQHYTLANGIQRWERALSAFVDNQL